MKKMLLLAALVFALYAVFSSTTVSAVPGCCCNPTTLWGLLVLDQSVCDPTYNFTTTLPNATLLTCNAVCNATFVPPITTVPPAIANCSTPTFKPAPSGLFISPVKGKNQLTISWNILPCPAYSINISRCKGADCTAFVQIAQIAPTTVYTDTDSALRWNTTYRYRLVANYLISGASNPAYITGNPGDIECWNQGYEQFCISAFYYNLFEKYLKSNGYAGTPASSFAPPNDFSVAVAQKFSNRLNKAWKCDDFNNLYRTDQMANCLAGQQCVVDESGGQCVTPSLCGMGGLFGMYASVEGCEGTLLSPKYCFFDRTRGSVDGCFGCSSRMSCADYRSRGACTRDNCHAGECEWRDVFPDIGIGACVDTRFSNCPWCTKPGTPGMENNESYNEVFDRCTSPKSDALSVTGYPCTFNKNTQESTGCDATACMDYTIAACGSPPGGITLNTDNSLATASSDTCGIKACQAMGAIGCIKNRDGNNASDCAANAIDRRACELDYFPPNTSLIASGNVPGRMDWLAIRMLDKFNATHDGTFMEGKPGYTLRVCVGDECDDPAEFIATNLSRLNFNDLSLQAGKNVIATMTVGQNALRYYAVDNRSNPEIIKNMTITACNACQGPKVLELTVTPGKVFAGAYYTISDIPVVTVSFNEPATLTAANLVSGSTVLPLTVTPGSGANYDYAFVPLSPLPDGTYTFTFNAKDNSGLLMDAPGSATIVVDTTPGVVTILPPDGTVLNVSSADISFIFTAPLTILNASLEQEIWTSKYAAKKVPIDLAPLLTSNDNVTYSTSVTNLTGGKKNLRVHAEDFAGNPTIGKSSFWVNTGPFQMRMREPSWGVAGAYVFDVIIDTTRIAQCRYLYDVPTAPPVNAFEFMAPFGQTTGVTHAIPGFDDIAPGDLSKHKLHVYCKLGTNITVQTFELSVDPTPPIIKSAFAQPTVIIERRVPNQEIFTTVLKVQTDDEGFCRYATENVPFVLMGNPFSGFDEVPKRSHDAELNVTQQNTTYTYYVACKNTAEKPSATVPVTFSVDLSVPFAAKSLTPAYSNTTNVSLRIETNKRAFCYYGDDPAAIITCMGACEYGYAHAQAVFVNVSGNHTWYVKCSTGAGNEVAALTIPVVVDTTPPFMLYVNDSSNLVEEPEYSYFLDRLQVSFLGKDNETAVSAYYYRLLTFFANTTLVNWTLSTNTNGTAFWVTGLNLTNGNKYRFETYPVNIVGLQGAPLASDGVTIDTTKEPEACQNGAKDVEETDVDCGGECAGCFDGAACAANTDCLSGFCTNGICAAPTCDDQVKDGNETDADCGGGVCLPCGKDKTCVQNTDCASGSCNNGLCGDPDPCADGVLSGTETDVDCGGSCLSCGDGKNCQTAVDCALGLLCLDSTCAIEAPLELPMHIQYNVTELPPETPTSPLKVFLWIFLILLILAALTVGGYLGYQYYLAQATPSVPPARPAPAPARPVRKLKPWPAVIEKLRGIARKEEPGIMDRDWVSLGALADRLKKEKVPVAEDVFGKLEDLLKGKISKREASSVLAAIRKEPEAFALLRRISFEQLTPAEKGLMRKRLALLKAGKLTPAEIEELLAKLRVTAAYYKTHKAELERELASWFNEGGRKK